MLIIHRESIMLMHRPQTPQPGFGSIKLLIQKFTPHFKILDPRLPGREDVACPFLCKLPCNGIVLQLQIGKLAYKRFKSIFTLNA